MQEKTEKLKNLLRESLDLRGASWMLGWDQSTYMPPGGAAARGRQTALLDRLAQEKFTNPEIGRLLDELDPYAQSLPFDSDEAALVRVTRREYERRLKLPPEFIERFSEHSAESYQVWTTARPQNDFPAVQPYLEKTLEMSREMANYFPGYEHIADPLIDFADYGMKASTLRTLFADLRRELVPIVQAISAQDEADDSCLRQRFPAEGQMAFCHDIAGAIGYDYNRGRLDQTHHPFTTWFSLGDVRITTRVKEDHLNQALFATIHETGHALYAQGVNPAYEASPLGDGASSGVHESQSRLWENLVGRSRGFWEHFYPRLQAAFPTQLGKTSLDEFYQAINKVERSLIRVEADEVTYNLHIMLRFDLGLALLEGRLAVRDLPDAWRARFQEDFGLQPPDDRDGVMQDVHWYGGMIGGSFQGYTLGNLLGAQFYSSALKAHPEIPQEIARGRFDTLLGWLRQNIYWHGSKYTPSELVERVTGGPVRIEPYIAYLRRKFGELYQL